MRKLGVSDRKGRNANEKNGQWRGDKAGYNALHGYIRRHKPKPLACELCGKITTVLDLSYVEHSRTATYTRNPDDYKYICRGCHMRSDGRLDRFHSSEEQTRLAKGYWAKVRAGAKDKAKAVSKTKIKRKRGRPRKDR